MCVWANDVAGCQELVDMSNAAHLVAADHPSKQ